MSTENAESFSISSDALRLEFLKTLIVSVGFSTKYNCRVSAVAFVVIIVCIIVFSEVEDLTCVKFRVV